MVTSMTVSTVNEYGSEDRSWLLGPHGTDMPINVVLDVAAFDATHFAADGLVKSGTVLAKITASGLYGPYTTADSTTGLGVAVGLLFNTVSLPASGTVADAALTHCAVKVARLPYEDDEDGGLDTAARADLKLINFVD